MTSSPPSVIVLAICASASICWSHRTPEPELCGLGGAGQLHDRIEVSTLRRASLLGLAPDEVPTKSVVADLAEHLVCRADVVVITGCLDPEGGSSPHRADTAGVCVQREQHVGIVGRGLAHQTLVPGVGLVVAALHRGVRDTDLVEMPP